MKQRRLGSGRAYIERRLDVLDAQISAAIARWDVSLMTELYAIRDMLVDARGVLA